PFVPLFYADKGTFFCLSINKFRILSVLNRLKIGILITIITKYCAKPLIRQAKTVQYKKRTV
ncbi:TPA: hypothetical protein ACHOSM_RS19255, partial [Escherichia coli]